MAILTGVVASDAAATTTQVPEGATAGAAPHVATAVAPGLTGKGVPAPAAAPRSRKPKVVVIGTGGTIAGVSDSRVSFQTYKSGQLPIGKLLDDLGPEFKDVADVKGVDFGTTDSASYTMKDYYDLSRAVDQQLAKADAVVVSTGTTTMEELGYWLDLTVRSDKPVVLTGAIRPWTVISSDGPANLYNAVMLAASGRTGCFGSVLLLNDQILPARDATKSNTTRLDTFTAPELGLLGVVDETRIRLERAPARVQKCGKEAWRTPFDLARIDRAKLPRVEVVYTYQEAGGEAITAYANAGVKGIVVAGAPSPQQVTAAMEVAKRGTVLAGANRNNAGATYTDAPWVLPAGDLPPQKARLLLMLALASSNDPARIQSWFAEYGDPEFDVAAAQH
nr:asparaginase [Actinopolymorpha pittospori]